MLLFINNVVPVVATSKKEYDHDALLEYEGYGKAMHEAIVRETTFIAGSYTENRDYVRDSIDEIGKYANDVYDELNRIGSLNGTEALKEIFSAAGGYVLTVGDFFKKLFSGYEEKKDEEVVEDYDPLSAYIKDVENGSFQRYIPVVDGYQICNPNRYDVSIEMCYRSMLVQGKGEQLSDGSYRVLYEQNEAKAPENKIVYHYYKDKESADAAVKSKIESLTKNNVLSFFRSQGFGPFYVKKNSSSEVIKPSTIRDEKIKVINKYIQENNPNVVLPQLRPSLTCPGGEKINLTIDGSTFLKSDGSVMLVDKDGTAIVNGTSCSLNFQVPDMDYLDDKPVIKDPEDNWVDMETGEKIDNGNGETENGEGCDNVLCFLKDIAGAIAGLVGKLLDGILALFVPDDLSFMEKEFEELKTKFLMKVEIITELQGIMTGVFDTDNSPALTYEISMPALDKPIKLMDMDIIAIGLPWFKKALSGVLVLFTVWYVYRKITGSGGVMEK